MKAVVSVIGKDRTGIIAAVSGKLNALDINIEDISQTIMQEYFVMIMLVDTAKSKTTLEAIESELRAAVGDLGVTVHVQHEDLFNAMQRV
ncbi:MAG: ACT domain-containing protein [Clostridiales bacterium]|nr:ACT domain-containing protein [Clostridiales bacterium]